VPALEITSEVLAEPAEEHPTEIWPELSKMLEVTSGDDFFASNIWLANCKMCGHSTSHVQISRVFVKFSSCSGVFFGIGDILFLVLFLSLDFSLSSTLSISKIYNFN